MSSRRVLRTVTGQAASDGAGVKLVRVLGLRTVRDFDPFLMLDSFDSTDPADYIRGFPMHPHRGIETFTYLVEGAITHRDSLGHSGTITDGAAQWMTAGSGILHEEMPQTSPRMRGLQLWINLPAAHKMTAPKYRNITPDQIPVVAEDGATIRVVTGRYRDTVAPIQGDYAPVQFWDVTLQPDTVWTAAVDPSLTLFAYGLDGTCAFDDKETLLPARHAVLFGDGDTIRLTAGADGARLVLVAGSPLREDVAWGGPIVMNSEAELHTAFAELENGSFLKHG